MSRSIGLKQDVDLFMHRLKNMTNPPISDVKSVSIVQYVMLLESL